MQYLENPVLLYPFHYQGMLLERLASCSMFNLSKNSDYYFSPTLLSYEASLVTSIIWRDGYIVRGLNR